MEPPNALFALRPTMFELDRLVREGITEAEFEATRSSSPSTSTCSPRRKSAELGYAIDSAVRHRPPEYGAYLKTALAKLTREDVNRAIRRHLDPGTLRVVMVTRDAEGLRDAILAGASSPITYNSPKPEAILAEDRIIQDYPVPVKPADITIIPEEQVFQ